MISVTILSCILVIVGGNWVVVSFRRIRNVIYCHICFAQWTVFFQPQPCRYAFSVKDMSALQSDTFNPFLIILMTYRTWVLIIIILFCFIQEKWNFFNVFPIESISMAIQLSQENCKFLKLFTIIHDHSS